MSGTGWIKELVRFGVIVCALPLVAAGCAGTEEETDTGPRIQALDKDSYVVGEVMEFHGENFLRGGEEGHTWVRFEGEFVPSDGGAPQPVEFEAPTVFKTDETGVEVVNWQRFGPFTNPFSDQGQAGVFKGKILPVNKYVDGTQEEGKSEVTTVEVEPSIEIVELQPVFADCGMPALNGFSGIPYRITVRAMGFKPEEFGYRISALANPDAAPDQQPTIEDFAEFHHAATGMTDTLDEEDNIVFLAVPPGVMYYTANIQVRAKDRASGNYVETFLPFEIHRPVEVTYNGNYELAEKYEPKPVSACIPGAIGNRAQYAETETDTRQQTVSIRYAQNFVQEQGISVSESWQEGYGTTDTVSETVGTSVTNTTTESRATTNTQTYSESDSNSFTYGTSDAEHWETRDAVGGTVGAEGEAGIPLVANGKVRAEARYDRTWVGGGSSTTSRNWGRTHTVGRSSSLSESYTLSNSNSETRSKSDTQSRSNSRTYNFGGAATESQRISQGITEEEQQTWSESKSHSTLTSYSGFIPVGKYGVFYRQTHRMVRRAFVIGYDACGVGEPMGQMFLNEWTWAPDLAVGESCDASPPASGLPPAECHIPPCD